MDLGERAGGRPALRPAVRLGAGPPRRRRLRLLHALDVASPDDVATGMRVQVRWAAERVGAHHRHRLLRAASRDVARRVGRARRGCEPREPRDHPEQTRHRRHHPGQPRLHLRRVAGGVGLLQRARRGPDPRPAVPGVPEGLRAAARRLPGRRRPDDRRGRAARPRHDHHVLHRQRPVPRPADRARRTSRRTSCSTAPTSPSST